MSAGLAYGKCEKNHTHGSVSVLASATHPRETQRITASNPKKKKLPKKLIEIENWKGDYISGRRGMFLSYWAWDYGNGKHCADRLASCTDLRDTFVHTKPGMQMAAGMSCKYLIRLLLEKVTW